MRDDGGAGRGDPLPVVRVLIDDHPAQQLHRRRRGNRKPSVRRLDPAPADRQRAAPPRGVEALYQPRRADDVRDRIVRPDLVEAHLVDGHPVHRRFRPREPREDVERPGPHPGVEIGPVEQGADVAVEVVSAGGFAAAVVGAVAVIVGMRSAIVRAGLSVPAACLVHREPRAGEGMVGMVDALDGGDRVEPGALKGRGERRLQLRPSVEHRRREHVAGDPADGIELDVHGDIVSRARGPHTRGRSNGNAGGTPAFPGNAPAGKHQ